jgi:hypothetical protein
MGTAGKQRFAFAAYLYTRNCGMPDSLWRLDTRVDVANNGFIFR